MMDAIPLSHNSDDRDFEMDENQYLLNPDSTNVKRGNRCCGCQCGFHRFCRGCCCWFLSKFRRKKVFKARTVQIGQKCVEHFPPNVIRNQKYNIITFIPLVLFQQFRFFLNLFFLIMATLQFIPPLRIGYLYTYWGPLGFVLTVTLIREAMDDIRRYKRDKETNSTRYKKLTRSGIRRIPSSHIKVGDLLIIEKDQRLPADLIFLRTSEPSGTCFIRTDQLDGETDWKLRLAVAATQKLDQEESIFKIDASVYAEAPRKDIHSFVGNFIRKDGECEEDSLSIENTLWANTVVASGTAIGVVVYTGKETRSVMNNSKPHMKVGLLDLEINQITKVLFLAVMGLALVMMLLKGFHAHWYIYLFRFVLLFSYIIPISLRVNLDMGKAFYSFTIMKDKKMPETVVRSTTIPEELGRISYLLTDKTGTLTKNEMVFKKLHLGNMSYSNDSFFEVTHLLRQGLRQQIRPSPSKGPIRRTEVYRILESVRAVALCHNVTPVYEVDPTATEADQQQCHTREYQASSPDEIALVRWAEDVGLSLIHRDLNTMKLKSIDGDIFGFTILKVFPFTSETKRMGIIVKCEETGEIIYYLKGADAVMAPIVQYNDWLDEEVTNMAREGLRTLVVAKKSLTQEQYAEFENRYNAAKLSLTERVAKVAAMIESLEKEMDLLCITGVEDRLQEDVRPTLEKLRNAGMKIWMLTGDKMETAECIAKSARLIQRDQSVHIFKNVQDRTEARLELNSFRRKNDTALIIQGGSLEICLQYNSQEFMDVACACPAVVCCRCSPTQKAEVVQLIQKVTKKRTAAIGDGGNDVSMIQAANAGIGIQGKEGNQASLAADFSLTQFSHVARLALVHGRYSYKSSAALSHFVIHRGLIISIMQAVFSSVFYFSSVALYQGFLLVGYATVYTMFPVFSLVLDRDVTGEIALTYPELYKELTKGRTLTFKTFFIWVLISMYQGGTLMYGALLMFEEDFIHIVAISFTALVFTELLMVALTIRTWHWVMVVSELLSLAIYFLSLVIFHGFFDSDFLMSFEFMWKVAVITALSCVPLYILKLEGELEVVDMKGDDVLVARSKKIRDPGTLLGVILHA